MRPRVPNGQLFEIRSDGSKKVVFDSDENNLLSLTGDGKDLLFVGTDPNGHVYRVNRKTGESFVIYDAAESEIAALAIDAKGNLYAGTAQSTGQEGPEADEPGASEKVGRPEQQETPTAVPNSIRAPQGARAAEDAVAGSRRSAADSQDGHVAAGQRSRFADAYVQARDLPFGRAGG
jgi:sugar lactone lactonase YvrE